MSEQLACKVCGKALAKVKYRWPATCGSAACVLARQGKVARACSVCGQPVKQRRVETKTKGFRWAYHKTCGSEQCKATQLDRQPMSEHAKRELSTKNQAAYFEKKCASEIKEIGLEWVAALNKCVRSYESRVRSRLNAATMPEWERLFGNMAKSVYLRDRRVRRTKPRPAKRACSSWERGLSRALAASERLIANKSVSAWERKFDSARSNWNRKRGSKR